MRNYMNYAMKFNKKNLYKHANNKMSSPLSRRFNKDGIYCPHEFEPDKLSWWEDITFIYKGRLIQVWWIHSRLEYYNQIENILFDQYYPEDTTHKRVLYNRLPSTKKCRHNFTKIYKKIGQSRKIAHWYKMNISHDARQRYEQMEVTHKELSAKDLGIIVSPTYKVEPLIWAQGLSIVAPIEIRCEADTVVLRDIAKSLIDGDSSVLKNMPIYSFEDWIKDQADISVN